ncbi:MAG TPA: hypothetical protein VMF30_15300 [Pirellulales bacterium]|nr:hypothetical protein [Pirellulales bacterium]
MAQASGVRPDEGGAERSDDYGGTQGKETQTMIGMVVLVVLVVMLVTRP